MMYKTILALLLSSAAATNSLAATYYVCNCSTGKVVSSHKTQADAEKAGTGQFWISGATINNNGTDCCLYKDSYGECTGGKIKNHGCSNPIHSKQ